LWRASTARLASPSFAGTYIGISWRRGIHRLTLHHSFDSIGCIDLAKDFIVAGTASDQLFGTCEGLWEPDLEPEDLFETISQALLNAVDRDALSGWGAHVYIIEKDKVTKRLLKGRQD
jgi:20S proteasome subunit beta 3